MAHDFGLIIVIGGPPSVYPNRAERTGLGAPPIYAALADGLDAPWRASDRAWFAAHPDRSHRARYPLPGELAAHGLDPTDYPNTAVLVRQMAPGARIRVPLRGPLPPDDDRSIGALLDAIAHGGGRGDGRGASEVDVRSRLALCGAGGRA